MKVPLLVILLSLVSFLIYNLLFLGRIYPKVFVAEIDVGGKTATEAKEALEKSISVPGKVELTSKEQTFEINLASIDFSYNFVESSNAAFKLFRSGNMLFDSYQRVAALFKNTNIGLRVHLNQEALDQNLSLIAGQIAIEPVEPSIKLQGEEIIIDNGKAGEDVDTKTLSIEIGDSLSNLRSSSIEISMMEIDPSLTEQEAESVKKRAENLLGKNLVLNYEYDSFSYKNADIFDLIDPKGEYKANKIGELVEYISDQVDRSAQNSVFVFEEGRVKEFTPSKNGVAIKKDTLKDMVIGNLRTLETSEDKTATIQIPADTTEPSIQTEDVNNLGINELIGRGSSKFAHSITSRIHNIGVASARFNGVLIAPGQTFSFNDTLGDVSAYTGYQQAYVIKDGRTVLGDGGGVCQVSTTIFRAALDAGLPIIERSAHSYRVGYYEQDSPPGIDATVYSPSPDFKFKNDTPGHILIQTIFDPARVSLVFEIYGTNDGRVISLTKPVVSSVTPPPEDLYVDDPTLPLGSVKQIDYKAWGAKANFSYTVKRAGETIYQKTFYSNYRPWQAVFLRGTGPAN